MSKKEEDRSVFSHWTGKVTVGVIFFSLVAIASTVYFYYYKFGFGLWEKPEQWANLGDFFGGVLNPIFSFSSIVLLLLALLQNHKALSQNEDALRLNNEELKLTRDELNSSSQALQRQAIIQDKQSFEGTFFSLLSIHQDLVNSIDLIKKENGVATTGKDCFKVFYNRLEKVAQREADSYYSARTMLNKSKEKKSEMPYDKLFINKAYKKFYDENESEIGHYFRNLYNIVKYVDESSILNKHLYTNILRAQLSTYEILLLLYNCTSDLGYLKFRPLVEKYGLLKGVSERHLFDVEKDKSFYDSIAFKNSDPSENMPNFF